MMPQNARSRATATNEAHMHTKDDLLKQVAAGFANMTTAEIDAFIKNAKLTAAQAKRANSKAARALEAKRLLLDGKLINFLLNQTTGEKIFLEKVGM